MMGTRMIVPVIPTILAVCSLSLTISVLVCKAYGSQLKNEIYEMLDGDEEND